VLQTAVDDCLNLSGNIADCKTPDGNQVFDLFTDQECSNCRLPSFVNEQVYGVLPKLPGCNPLTSGPEMAVPASCPATPMGSASAYFTDLTTTKHWQYLGCGTDMINNRTFQGQSTTNDQMTVEKCVDFCSSNGYKYAGMEYSTQYASRSLSLIPFLLLTEFYRCYCDNSLPSDRAPIPGIMGNCLMTCAGNSNEFCGSAAALSIYQNCAGLSTCQNAVIGSSGTTPGTPSSSGVYGGSTSSNIPSRSTPASSYTPMNSPAQTSITANAKY
jgi:WSC domain-containing protein